VTTEERICERDSFKSGVKTERVVDGESKGGKCDEVICAG